MRITYNGYDLDFNEAAVAYLLAAALEVTSVINAVGLDVVMGAPDEIEGGCDWPNLVDAYKSLAAALENVGLPMLFQGFSRDERKKRAFALLQRVGLEERALHKPAEMSGGQQQRVAIARALANDPKVILADEPTGNLDSATGKQVIAMLKELHSKEHKTIIMVTHDKDIARHADRIVKLQDGKIAG